MAFSATSGHFEYCVMPYGVSLAPAAFKCLMNDILHDALGKYVIVYINNIMIYSTSKETHIHHSRKVLDRLLENKLYVKGEKCKFHQISHSQDVSSAQKGYLWTRTRSRAITNQPVPTTVKELQRFLGFTNFSRRFFRGFSTIASPLTSLLKNRPETLHWNPSANQAFEHLTEAFTSAPHS